MKRLDPTIKSLIVNRVEARLGSAIINRQMRPVVTHRVPYCSDLWMALINTQQWKTVSIDARGVALLEPTIGEN